MRKILCAIIGLLFTIPSWANETCKNLYNPSYIYSSDFELVDGNILRNKKTDDRQNARFNFYIRYGDGGNKIMLTSITSPGEYTAKFTVPDADTPITFYHSGTSIDLTLYTGQKLTPGSYVVSIKVLGTDPRVVGGLQIQDIKIYPAECYDIRVATTKYVESEFAPMVSALQSAISVVDSVVTQTITQAASIATLQSGKQTRPADDTCPAYKQCLLVEDEQGVPHWYQITDPFRDFVAPIIANNVAPASTTNQPGYTQLQYIESTGTQYIDTGITPSGTGYEFDVNVAGISGKTGAVIGNQRTSMIYMINGSRLVIYHGNVNLPVSDVTAGVMNNVRLTFNGTQDIVQFNGVEILREAPASTDYRNTYLFANLLPAGSGVYDIGAIRLGNVKMYNDGALVRNFVPAKRNSDNVVGMYDTVSKTFFTNAGSGTFSAGPTVANTDVPANGTWSWTWTANASNGISAGTLSGIAICNNVSANVSDIATSAQMASANWTTAGGNCWCTRTGVDTDGVYTAITDNHSVLRAAYDSSGAGCRSDCADNCARGYGNATVRSRMIAL